MERQNRLLSALSVVLLVIVAFLVLDWDRVDDEPRDLDGPATNDLFAYQTTDITRLVLTRPDGEVVFEQEEGQWKLTQPVVALAKASAVDAIVDRFESVRVEEKSLDGAAADYGLDDASRTTVRLEKADGTAFTVHIGKDTPIGYKTYAKVPGDDAVHLLDNQVGELVAKPVEDFRSREVLAFSPGGVTRIRLVQAGVETVLRKDDAGWWIGDTGPRADQKRVGDWLSAVSLMKAERFLDGQDASALGLESPAALVAVQDDGGTHTLRIGTRDELGANASAAEVPFRIANTDLLALLPADGWASPRLLDAQSWKVDALTLVLGADKLEVDRSSGAWAKAGGGEAGDIDTVVDAVLDLAVDRTATPTMSGSWGRITLGLGKDKLVVQIGDVVPGGRVAKEEAGGPAFVIPDASLATLADGLAGKLLPKPPPEGADPFGGGLGGGGDPFGGMNPEDILKQLGQMPE